jgi:hypothetical protein
MTNVNDIQAQTTELQTSLQSESAFTKLNPFSIIISVFSSIIAFGYLAALLKYFNYGFDFTDEAVYLLLMERPEEYTTFHILSGFIYQPLYNLTNGNVFHLRVINFLFLLAIAYNLSRLLLQTIAPKGSSFKGLFLHLSSFQLSLCASVILLLWLPTPNYNLLNYIAIMIVATGILIISRNISGKKLMYLVGWLLVAIGGYLSFMSRPHTALFLGIMVIIWASVTKNFKPKWVIFAFISALILISFTSLYIEGSIFGIFQRFFMASRLETLSENHHPLQIISLNFDSFLYVFSSQRVIIGSLFLLYGFSLAFFEQNKILFKILFILCPILLFFFLLNYLNLFWHNLGAGYLLWLPILGYIVCLIWKNRSAPQKSDKPLLIFLILLTGIYGLGSNNSYFVTTSLSSYFILLGLFSILTGTSLPQNFPSRVIVLSSISLIVTIGIVITGLGNPYRQPSVLWSYNSQASIRVDDPPLTVSPFTATYLQNLHSLANDIKLQPNSPIIDLSGGSPGTMYALGGYTPKTPWIYSGARGSNKLFFFAINMMSCSQIANSLVIFENTAIRPPLNPSVLNAFGQKFPDDYLLTGMVMKHSEFNRYRFYTTQQLFFKPKRPLAQGVAECQKAKEALGLR